MSEVVSKSQPTEVDEGYAAMEALIDERVHTCSQPIFETDADPGALWGHYLGFLAEDRRQHYNCHACRRFIQAHGGLVTINEGGGVESLLWGGDLLKVPKFFLGSAVALRDLTERAKIIGVFLSSDSILGTPKTPSKKGLWSHLSTRNPKPYEGKVKTAGQAAAEKREEHGMLQRALADYPLPVVQEAVRVLKADALSRGEKALGIAEWFRDAHGKSRNQLWRIVATAPPGFCHVRTTIISTLLDDVAAGLPFDEISRRWAEKTHPLQYQRPSAAPTTGAIEAAEKLVQTLGVAKSLNRRFARLSDVLSKLWTPTPEAVEEPEGVFGHLRSQKTGGVKAVNLPPLRMTWEKFAREVLPGARSLEVKVPYRSASFYGLVTAADPEAPAIIQWDGLEGRPRNPTSWYFYAGGSTAAQWGLSLAWESVSAVFLAPHRWQDAAKFSHHGDVAFFSIKTAKDSRAESAGLALFPEILKADLHGIRSVIEAHSRSGEISGAADGDANGIAFQKGPQSELTVRADGTATYVLDRWD